MLKMSNKKIVLIGCGAQGRVALDILEDSGIKVFGFLDDNDSLRRGKINNKPIIGKIHKAREMSEKGYKFIICIGNNHVRKGISQKLKLGKSSYVNIIHRSSVVLKSASVGYGNMIFANTYIGSNAQIGNHIIINNGCVIEHDCILGDFASLSPGCCMGGRVTIGAGAFISTGVTIKPRIAIGANSIVGVGSVVVKDIPECVLAYGVPAKVIRRISPGEMWDRLL
jgi:acetyltransferase EpsM